MNNLMIDSPTTRHSPLSQKTSAPERQKISPSLAQTAHSPFLTSELLVPQNARTVEQELVHYIQQAYPRARRSW